jgi:hypothetical protein
MIPRRMSLFIALFLLTALTAVAAPIRYDFHFTPKAGSPGTPFSFSFDLPGYVTSTGLFALPSPVSANGYTFVQAGTNVLGAWVFGGSSVGINDIFASAAPTPGELNLALDGTSTSGYITSPGAYFFSVGLAIYGRMVPTGTDVFSEGTADLTVTDLGPPAPEPASVALLSAGLVCLALLRRRRR